MGPTYVAGPRRPAASAAARVRARGLPARRRGSCAAEETDAPMVRRPVHVIGELAGGTRGATALARLVRGLSPAARACSSSSCSCCSTRGPEDTGPRRRHRQAHADAGTGHARAVHVRAGGYRDSAGNPWQAGPRARPAAAVAVGPFVPSIVRRTAAVADRLPGRRPLPEPRSRIRTSPPCRRRPPTAASRPWPSFTGLVAAFPFMIFVAGPRIASGAALAWRPWIIRFGLFYIATVGAQQRVHLVNTDRVPGIGYRAPGTGHVPGASSSATARINGRTVGVTGPPRLRPAPTRARPEAAGLLSTFYGIRGIPALSARTANRDTLSLVSDDINLWRSAEHAQRYLAVAYQIPRREEGEASLLECVPAATRRILDLGSGEGRLAGLPLDRLPEATAVALDFSDEMLGRLHARFDADPRVSVCAHESLDAPSRPRNSSMPSSPVSPSTTSHISENARCTRRPTRGWSQAACSGTWSTWRRQPRNCISGSWRRSGSPRQKRILRASCGRRDPTGVAP